MIYGYGPEVVGIFEPEWDEYMHYMYLPVVMPGRLGFRLPSNLHFLENMVRKVMMAESAYADRKYVYVTARRGFATPGNPLNRPGWHSDGFGTDDINYIWADRWPTRFATGEFGEISEDHIESANQFEERVMADDVEIWEGEPNMVYRLDPSVIHSTPIIPPPGGERSFFKISVSTNKFNLKGNSHNYLFDYDWKMWDRDEVRNHPCFAGGDAGPDA